MRRFLVIPVVAACLSVAAPAVAGQPNASCESPRANPPPGFSTGGFANAESHYAGSEGTPSTANGNSHAVSQYDFACFGGPKHYPPWRDLKLDLPSPGFGHRWRPNPERQSPGAGRHDASSR